MNFTWLDFLTGLFFMNAMPHLLFGIIRLRFLSAFGFSAVGNLVYALLNLIIAGGLYHYQYGIESIINDGIVVGSLTILVIYLFIGRILINLFQEK